MSKETAVFFRHGSIERAALNVVERSLATGSDVQIIIRSERDEHLSLHRDDSGLLLTHWSAYKPPSVWDADRVMAASAMGFRDPERHGKYYQHQHIYPDEAGWLLLKTRVTLSRVTEKSKYAKRTRIVIAAPSEEFMLAINLATPPESPSMEPDRVNTRMGDLYFVATRG